jgi:hypothetical protein
MGWAGRMRQCALSFVLAFSLAGSLCFASDPDELPAGIELRDYTGWPGIFINAVETPVQAVIVPSIGARVVHFSLNGENILFENPATAGKTMTADNPEDLWLGGYQCDVGPHTRGLPRHLQLLQEGGQWNLLKGGFAAHAGGAPDCNVGVVIDKDFVLAPDTGELGIMQRMRNVSTNDVSWCLWDRTLCKGGGFAFFPLNKKSRFKAGWSQQQHANGRDYYDGDKPGALQVRILDGVLVVTAAGDVTRLGADSTAGWIAYARGKLLFVKYFPWFAHGDYSDGGNTVEVYFDQRAVELSPLSPETKLAPGREYTFPEKWLLIPLAKEVNTWEDARKLVRKIPPSPFGS